MGGKIIGVVGNLQVHSEEGFPSYHRIFANKDYLEVVEECGGVPIILPFTENYYKVREQIKLVDKVIITGGVDINPFYYGEESIINGGTIIPERDNYDFMIIKACEELNKPIFGICRGMQSINVAYGGTLYQHIPEIKEFYLQHSQKSAYDVAVHKIKIKNNTKLHSVLGEEEKANSFHHQSIKDLAPNFIISAFSNDGVVEAIENIQGTTIIGVQWHPEKMYLNNEGMKELFHRFINIYE
ncbi:MAG: gamma-glutamyl-gamma-aminobutyrate hydrolase family protein [Clostridiaceae bacterium]